MRAVFDPNVESNPGDPEEVYRGPLPAKAVKVRRAATLILVDRSTGEPRVLMGRRGAGHVFMPNKWVFPGGRAERGDAFASSATDISPQVAAALSQHTPRTSARMARALGMAAIRELREEAGLHLDAPTRHGPALPDLSALELVGRAITPPYRPKRFDALFFAADAVRLLHPERRGGDGELDEIAWFTLPAAFELDLPNVTQFILKELEERLTEPGRPPVYLRYLRRRHTVTALPSEPQP
ncbi:NUDIX domain-containing protein [soil metagenome]